MDVSAGGGNLGGGQRRRPGLNRLTQSYVVGAISGTATIVVAVVAFVMLVSLQTLQEWPVSGFGPGSGSGHGDDQAGTRAHGPASPARPTDTATAVPLQGASKPTAPAGPARADHAGPRGGGATRGRGKEAGHVSSGAPTG